MRAVSAGMGPMAWGYIVMLLLLLSARRFRFPVSYHFYFYFHSPAESFRVARGVGGDRVSPRYQRDEQVAGDHKGPPIGTKLRMVERCQRKEMTKPGVI